MGATPRPWVVERHDQDDGQINYEIWCQSAPTYHRVVTLNDYDNEAARDDAKLIVKSVNEAYLPNRGSRSYLFREAE